LPTEHGEQSNCTRCNASKAQSLWIIAGPEGVGKTTFAKARIAAVSGSTKFVNLDLIAHGLSPLAPNQEQIRAARVALDMMRDLIARRETFAIETTLAGRGHKGLIAEAKAAGFKINLLYFFVSTPEEALRRIARRVAEGGHDVPERDARRRYGRSLAQFADYARLCDLWRIYDTDGPEPRLRAEGSGDQVLHRAPNGSPLPTPLAAFVGA
jgi:predicted ABC-type ATPase